MTLEAFTETTHRAREDRRSEGAALAAGARHLLATPERVRRGGDLGRVVVLPVEIVTACLAGVGTAATTGWVHPQAALAALATWVVAVFAGEHGRALALHRGLLAPLRGLGVVMALASMLVATGLLRAASLPVVLAGTAAATLTSMCARLLWTRGVVTGVLVVGDPGAAVELAGRRSRLEVRGVVSTASTTGGSASEDVEAFVDEVRRAALDEDVDAVLVVPGEGITPDVVRRLCWALDDDGISMLLGHAAGTVSPHRLQAVSVDGRSLLAVRPSHRPVWCRATKQLLDRALALLLLTLTGPVLLTLCALVRLDSAGPAVFRQQRVGRRGQPFTMYKLRTMHTDAELLRVPLQRQQSDRMLFKMVDDPRITRVGRFLRRSSLDELPQLVNVLKGDMSLVGPRPALPEEVARYDGLARRRLHAKPGLSGLWQVSGRSDLDWEQSLALDLHYVDNSRLVDDVWILARTVHAVIASKGAY